MRRFVLKPEHVILLRAAAVSWNESEFGAPTINPKRPYGNSNVYVDMCKLLDIELDEDRHVASPLRDELDKLHAETKTALEVVLVSGSFEPGTYQADDYRANWSRLYGGQS